LHSQIVAVINEYESAGDRLHRLEAATPDERWSRRRDPARWSVAECVAHLNLTSRAYLPLIDAALTEARQKSEAGPSPTDRRLRRDLAGWLLWRVIGPPVRMKMKTTTRFIPEADLSREQSIAEFDHLQREQIERARGSDGLPIDQVSIVSPFNKRLKYNLYSCLTILPRHMHRHLWQAEHVWKNAAAQASGS